MKKLIILSSILFLSLTVLQPLPVLSQDDKKGDLEDFADDYGDEDEDGGADDAAQFFIVALIDNFGDFARLWGRAPGTEFGPYPSFPYDGNDGFMAAEEHYRSYFFNSEFSYQPLNTNLRNYLLKWETQFVRSSKLSFDFSVYNESIRTASGTRHDRMSTLGIRYGYALYRTPQMIVNIEGGFRGLYRNRSHGGPELAFDLQLFPKKPLILETEVSAAYLSDWLFIVDASAGVALGRFELLGGIRLLKNGGSDMLDGFRFGLRVWY